MIRTGVTPIDLSSCCTPQERIDIMRFWARWIIGQDLWDDDRNKTATIIGAAHVGDQLYVVLEMEGECPSGHESMEASSWLMQLVGFLTRRPTRSLGGFREALGRRIPCVRKAN